MNTRALFDVKGKVACVTGASSGLGRAAATTLAEAGALVVGVARRTEELDRWRSETAGETAALQADLGDRNSWAQVAEGLEEIFGPPDILINAAGKNPRLSAEDVRLDDWQRTFDVNLSAPFFLAQSLVGPMKDREWGRIINFASLQSRRAFPNGIAYGASKGGVEQMTRAMAEAWSPCGVNVNALAPGFFPTELTASVFSDSALAEQHAQQTCVGRNGKLSDLAGPLLFLSSRASDYVTGQVLFVDGGFTAK